MSVTNYYSVNSILLGEKPSGSNRADYLSDALGSVTATVNSSAAVVNTYRYKPYGTQLTKTGSGSDPAFTWVGQYGYRQTNRQFSNIYVRARHGTSSLGRWNTKDPMKEWVINGYRYSMSNPICNVDPTGNLTITSTALGAWKIGQVGECGEFDAYWDFKLSRTYSQEGYLVQKVLWKYSWTGCSGGDPSPPLTLWEAWKVPANQLKPFTYGLGYTDQFSLKKQMRTKSEQYTEIYGRVKFFFAATRIDNPNVGDIQRTIREDIQGWKGCGGISGTLPCTTERPWWFDGDKGRPSKEVKQEGSKSHSAKVKWNCCPCENQFNESEAEPM